MKRWIFLLCVLSCTVVAGYAQHRKVRLPEKPKQAGYTDYSQQESGFWCAVEAEGGSSVKVHGPNMQYVNLWVTGGYRVSEYLRVGVGIGGRMYVHNAYVRDADSKFGMPIYANVRGNFLSAYDRQNVPFWSFNVGGITHEGFFANPTLGYSFGGLRNNFLLGLSYTITSFKDYAKSCRAYSYLGLKLGYEF